MLREGLHQRVSRRSSAGRVGLLLLAASLLASCASTHEQVLRGQIALHDNAIASSKQTLAQLQADGGGPGAHELRLYVADRILNDALAALDDYSVAIPNDPATKATIKSIRFSHYGTLPAVELDIAAARGLVDVAVEAKAVLVPTATPGEFQIRVLSFVPRVRWYWIEFTKARFIRELLAVEVDKLTATLPTVKVPLEQSLVLGAPGRTETITFPTSPHPSTLTVAVQYPSTVWNAKLTNAKYYFVKSGIYVFGELQ